MAKSKILSEQTCIVCGKKFQTNTKAIKYCSEECRKKQLSSRLRRSTEMFSNPKYKKDIDYVECPICHGKGLQLRMDHYKRHGYRTREEVEKDFPGIKFSCQKFIEDNLCGENNPLHSSKNSKEQRQQNSPFSIEFYIKKYNGNKEKAEEKLREFLNNLDFEHRKLRIGDKQYWLNLGYSYKEATQKVSEVCVNNGIDYYIKKFGEDEGKKKYHERIEKWIKSCKNSAPSAVRSNAADNFFKQLVDGESIDDNYRFGDKEIVVEGKSGNTYLLDFCKIDEKKVIEFNGDYWHCNPIKYGPEYYNANKKLYARELWKKDEDKKKDLEESGYQIMIVWEYDWRNHKEETINKAKKFIFG